MMIGRRSVVVALAFLDRERSIGAGGWRRDLLIERIREHNEIEAKARSRHRAYRDNRIAEGVQRALRALERGDLDDAERHCEQAERYVVRKRAFRSQQGFFENPCAEAQGRCVRFPDTTARTSEKIWAYPPNGEAAP